MRIVNKYLLKELGGPFISSLIVSTIILAAGNIIQLADMIVNKGVDIISIVKIFILLLPFVLTFTIPISVLSAILLGFGRLSNDNEITALRTSGFSVYSIILPAVICGFIISLVNVPLNDRILPQSEFAARRVIKQLGVKHPIALLESGVFVKGFKDYIVFVHSIEGNTLKNIRIYQPREEGATRTIIAKRGEIISLPGDRALRLRLEDGTADEVMPDNPDEFYKLTFKEYHMTIDVDKAAEAGAINKKNREKNIRELSEDIKKIGPADRGCIPLRVELHKKIALAFSNLIFVMIGIPLAMTTHRREKFIGFGMAMTLFLLYWGVMLGGIAFAIRGLVPAWLGVWSANMLLFAISSVMLYKVSVK